MTGTDADLELVVAAVEAELDRDWEAYMARLSSPAGIADDAPAPPQRYTTSPLRIARAARKAVLEGLMEPGEETIRAGAESPGGKALDSLATFGHVHGFKLPSDPPPLVSCWQAMLRRKLEECA